MEKTFKIDYAPNTVWIVEQENKVESKLCILNSKASDMNAYTQYHKGIQTHCKKCKERLQAILN